MSDSMNRVRKCAHRESGGLSVAQLNTRKGDTRELIRDPKEEAARVEFVRQRIALDWSQPRAAFELKVSVSTIIAWESPFERTAEFPGGHKRIAGFAVRQMRIWAGEAGFDSNGRMRCAGVK